MQQVEVEKISNPARYEADSLRAAALFQLAVDSLGIEYALEEHQTFTGLRVLRFFVAEAKATDFEAERYSIENKINEGDKDLCKQFDQAIQKHNISFNKYKA